jgi:UDP-N-acetylglucosamine:LPS N-acetylglucosamine transferase
MTSEALQLGKKILVKPLHAQVEQTSNAAALQQLGYAHVMNELDTSVVEHWLHDHQAVHVTYPNTAQILTQWIKDGMPEMDMDFIEEIWSHVDVLHLER